MTPRLFYDVPFETVVKKADYETAAWWMKVLIQPGEYEATFVDVKGRPVPPRIAYYVHVAIPGVVVDAYFPALFGGVRLSDGKRPELIGTDTTYHLRFYAYEVARMLLVGEKRWRAEGVVGEVHHFDIAGKTGTTHRLKEVSGDGAQV